MPGFNMKDYDSSQIDSLLQDVLAEKEGMTADEVVIFDSGRSLGMFQAIAIMLAEIDSKGDENINLNRLAKKIAASGFLALLESE